MSLHFHACVLDVPNLKIWVKKKNIFLLLIPLKNLTSFPSMPPWTYPELQDFQKLWNSCLGLVFVQSPRCHRSVTSCLFYRLWTWSWSQNQGSPQLSSVTPLRQVMGVAAALKLHLPVSMQSDGKSTPKHQNETQAASKVARHISAELTPLITRL